MSEILNLKQILEHSRVKKGIYNFLCMKGSSDFPFGRFFIPESEQEQFWRVYGLAAPFFTAECSPKLVYRPPQRVRQPLNIDVDLRFEEETNIPTAVHGKFAVCIAQSSSNY